MKNGNGSRVEKSFSTFLARQNLGTRTQTVYEDADEGSARIRIVDSNNLWVGLVLFGISAGSVG